MAAPNQVKVNLRHNILLLNTFTVPELQDITGLKRQSIYTEVRRMEKQQLISRIGTREREKGSAGGRPPILYKLTSDPDKRFEVLQSVRAFDIQAETQPSELPRPESKHYFIAKHMLDEIRAAQHDLMPEDKTTLLDQVYKRLQYARQEEEVGEGRTELIAISLDILEAQATDILLGDWDSAVKTLDRAREACIEFEAEDLVGEINSHIQTIVDRIAENQRRSYIDEEFERVQDALQDLHIIEHRFGDLPGIQGGIKYAELIASEARERQIDTRAEEKASDLVTKALRQRHRTLQNRTQPPLVWTYVSVEASQSEPVQLSHWTSMHHIMASQPSLEKERFPPLADQQTTQRTLARRN